METINFDKTAILAQNDPILPKSKSPKALETKDFEKQLYANFGVSE